MDVHRPGLHLLPPPATADADLYVDLVGRTAMARQPLRQPFKVLFSGWCFHAVTGGAGIIRADEHTLHVGPGDIYLFCPGQRLAYGPAPEQPWSYTFVSMRGRRVAAALEGLGLARQPQAVHIDPQATWWRWLGDAYDQALHGDGGGLFPVAMAWNFLQGLLAARAPGRTSQAADLAAACVQILHQRLGEDIGVAELARHLGVHRTTVFRAFTQTHGLAPVAYLTRLRIEHARELLQRTDLDVQTIARRCGFSDASYFARAFRRLTGLAPAAWRRQQLSACAAHPPAG